MDIREDEVEMGHEASVSKISEDQLFYLMSRGITEDEAAATIVRGKGLPLRFPSSAGTKEPLFAGPRDLWCTGKR